MTAHGHVSTSDFRSAVLRGVVTEQQYNFFREQRYLQVTSSSGNKFRQKG